MSLSQVTVASALALVTACHSPDPGLCQPGDATFSTLTGAVVVQGGMNQTFDLADGMGTTPCTILSRPSGNRDADLETRTTISLSCSSQGETLELSFEIDDVRHLGAGLHGLMTDDSGLWIAYRPSESAPRCYTQLPNTAYDLEVTEAAGGFEPYPTLVTSDFHRRFDVSLDLALQGYKAKQYTDGNVSACTLDFTGTIDFTAVLDAADYEARGTDTCVYD